MIIQPVIESLIFHINSDKTYVKENLLKWSASLPKDEKNFIQAKIHENISKPELLRILNDINVGKISFPTKGPIVYKKGDVLMHPIFQHPYILLEKKNKNWICCMLTTESECKEILSPCESRFFKNSFFTKMLLTMSEPIGKYMFPYENPKQLKDITKSLKYLFY
jgi:hypothetical protein